MAARGLFAPDAPRSEGAALAEPPLPALGSIEGVTGEWDGDEAFFGFSSYTRPPAVHRITLADGAVEPWQQVPADLDPAAFDVRLAHCRSRDGTPLSLFLVRRSDRPADGQGPACSRATAASASA